MGLSAAYFEVWGFCCSSGRVGPKDTRPCGVLRMCLSPRPHTTLPGGVALCEALPLPLEGILNLCTCQPTSHWLRCAAFSWLMVLTFISEVGPMLIPHDISPRPRLSVPLYGIPFPFLQVLCLSLIVGVLSGFVIFAYWPLVAKVGKNAYIQVLRLHVMTELLGFALHSPKCPSLDDTLQDYLLMRLCLFGIR